MYAARLRYYWRRENWEAVAQILRGFDAKVLVFDPEQDLDWANKYGIDYVDYLFLIKRAISFRCMCLVPETFHMLDNETFDQNENRGFHS